MSKNVYKNTIILKNGTSAPSESTLQKAELGFDTLHDILFVGRDSPLSPIPLSPYFSDTEPTLNVENLLWVDTSDSSGVIPIKMGGTGANTAENALTNLHALSLSGGTLDKGASIYLQYESDDRFTRFSGAGIRFIGAAGGWASGITWQAKNDETKKISIANYGEADSVHYLYIGQSFGVTGSENALRIYPDNTIAIGSANYGTTTPATGVEGQIFFVKAE